MEIRLRKLIGIDVSNTHMLLSMIQIYGWSTHDTLMINDIIDINDKWYYGLGYFQEEERDDF